MSLMLMRMVWASRMVESGAELMCQPRDFAPVIASRTMMLPLSWRTDFASGMVTGVLSAAHSGAL
ncbi:MAG: hypothetical protein KGO02_11085 [Alphaproteobacteria bacterium]|nr:hypothetical protein [Alphaproteobacteria bacterium]